MGGYEKVTAEVLAAIGRYVSDLMDEIDDQTSEAEVKWKLLRWELGIDPTEFLTVIGPSWQKIESYLAFGAEIRDVQRLAHDVQGYGFVFLLQLPEDAGHWLRSRFESGMYPVELWDTREQAERRMKELQGKEVRPSAY